MSHSLLGPSSAKRYFNCPGSVNLLRTLPPEAFKPKKYAAEGTVAHQLAEDFVTNRIDLVALLSRVGEVVMQEGFEVEITDEMVEGVIEYADHIAVVRRRLSKPASVVAKAEVRTHAKSVDEEAWGTTDYLLYQKGHELHVFDFKYGKTVVEAEDNEQGECYVVGAQDRWEDEKEEGAAGAAFDKVFFHIIQPRAGGVKTWELPKGRVEAFRKEWKAAIDRTRDPKAPRVPGDWCTFCPARAGYCPELNGQMTEVAQTVFTDLPAPPSKEVGMMSLPPVASLTPEQLSRVLYWEDVLDSFTKACRERAQMDLARDPDSVPGHKLVEGRANRVWGSETEADAGFAMLGEERYAPRKLKSPAQMEKIAGKDEVAKYAVKPAGKLTVARMDDKRPAVNKPSSAEAQHVFGVIETAKVANEDIFGDLAKPATKEKKETIWPT